MKGIVYILSDTETGKFYIGSTNNIKRRIHQHRIGHTVTTSRMKSPKIVFIQEFESLAFARKIEHKLKKFKRRDFIEKVIKEGKIRIAGD